LHTYGQIDGPLLIFGLAKKIPGLKYSPSPPPQTDNGHSCEAYDQQNNNNNNNTNIVFSIL